MASLGILGALSAISGVVGTGLSIFGAIQQGKAEAASQEYQANVAQANANIADKNAERTQQSAAEEQYQQDQSATALFGEQEAAQGASGLSLKSKSFISTRRSARQLSRLDALNIRQQGDVQAFGYRTDAANQVSSSEMHKAAGKNALTASYLNAGSSLIGGASSIIGGLGKYSAAPKRATSTFGTRDPWAGMRTARA